MTHDKTEVQVKRRRPISFALRITFGQFVRFLRVFLAVDALFVVICASLALITLDRSAERLLAIPSRQEAEEAGKAMNAAVSIGEAAPEHAIYFRHSIEEFVGLVPEAARSLVFWRTDSPGVLWGWRPEYTVAVETERDEFNIVTFDLTEQALYFLDAVKLLGVIEFIMLWGQTAATRKSVRKILAPIQQLAVATWDISAGKAAEAAEPVSPKKRKKAEKERLKRERLAKPGIELSGTIRTLNQINAKHLDTRIPIDEERAELRGLAIAINGMLDRLDAAYSSQARFVSDASHELRTPIAVIQGYANLLDRWGKEDPEALQESIAAIKAEAEGMKELVEQLLFLARSDNDTLAVEMEPIDASALAAEVLRNTEIIDEGHAFTADIQPGCLILGDDGLIRQALRIFMDNAVKYSPAGESIKLAVRQEEGKVMLSVTDHGIGIPEEDLPHVVERFFRSDESRARATGGTGLGLSIASWIIRRHDGALEILSRRDIGTKMTVVLPAAEQRPLALGEDRLAL